MVATRFKGLLPLSRVHPTQGNADTEGAEAQESTKSEQEDADRKQLCPAELHDAAQDHLTKCRDNTQLYHEVNSYSVLFKVNDEQAHQLDHDQHEEHLSDDNPEVKARTKEVLEKNNQRPNHESKEDQNEGDNEHVLSCLEESPREMVNFSVWNVRSVRLVHLHLLSVTRRL